MIPHLFLVVIASRRQNGAPRSTNVQQLSSLVTPTDGLSYSLCKPIGDECYKSAKFLGRPDCCPICARNCTSVCKSRARTSSSSQKTQHLSAYEFGWLHAPVACGKLSLPTSMIVQEQVGEQRPAVL